MNPQDIMYTIVLFLAVVSPIVSGVMLFTRLNTKFEEHEKRDAERAVSHETRDRERHEELNRRLEEHHKSLYGNGKEGAIAEIGDLQHDMDNVETVVFGSVSRSRKSNVYRGVPK